MENLSATPLSNRGVEKPKKCGMDAVVDWVQATFHIPSIFTIMEDVLKLPRAVFKHRNSGLYYYNRGFEFGNIKIFYSDKHDDMGFHLQISGSGCREFEHYLTSSDESWKDFFKRSLKYNAKFTRIDIAIDDYKTYLKIPRLIKKAQKGECITQFRAGSSITGFNLTDGKHKGSTFYIGSKKSHIYCRFYEKNYEQAFQLKCDVEDIGLWNRYEIQLRRHYAVNCAEILSGTESISEIVRSILNKSMRFVTEPKDSLDERKPRWPIYQEWERFIKGADKINLSLKPSLKSIEDNIDWLCKQVATTLDTVLTAEAMALSEGLLKDTDFLEKILAHSNFNDEHTDRIDNYLNALKNKKTPNLDRN
ncbi:replication initiation factor domain-containing protein [Staphylococcus agnetis]|uniref:replication initiation factor domain-containing protein n=1 Tax=Staphylococcus agnetis TaxID=985762 RepID=UPI0021D055B7|nr:replication initiation factor domain-containing protein [Staphylococcus agnetis]UXU65159.1 replication initiation factor domain-containing protein [Staphylococcus agnetis]